MAVGLPAVAPRSGNLVLQACIGVADVPSAAVPLGDAEAPHSVVELAQQLDDLPHDLGVGAVGARDHVAAALVPRLLQGLNGLGGGDTSRGGALGYVVVARGLLQLVDLHPPHVGEHTVHGGQSDLTELFLVNISLHLNDAAVGIQKLLLVDAQGPLGPVAHAAGGVGVFQNVPVQLVDVALGIAPHRDEAVARGAPLLGVENIQHDGVKTVIVPASLGVGGVILGGVEQHVPRELGVVQNGAAVGPHPLVVPVHYGGLVPHPLVSVEVAAPHVGGEETAVVPHGRPLLLQMRVAGEQLGGVAKPHQKEVGTLLNVPRVRLPEEIEKIHPTDVHVSHPVLQSGIPEDSVGRHPVLELAPDTAVVGLGEAAPLGDDGQNVRKQCRLGLVVGIAGENGAGGHGVAEIGVLVADAAEEPR